MAEQDSREITEAFLGELGLKVVTKWEVPNLEPNKAGYCRYRVTVEPYDIESPNHTGRSQILCYLPKREGDECLFISYSHGDCPIIDNS